MRTVAIVQARMGSTRLPGKVMRELCGDTMLAHTVRRIRQASSITQVAIATSDLLEDDQVVEEARRIGVMVYRGSASDVLARTIGCAHAAGADVVVRITSDCPMTDPGVIDRVCALMRPGVDYVSNTHGPGNFPRGLDVEAVHRDTLDRIGRMATSRPAREHVTAFVMEQPALFRTDLLVSEIDDSDLRWTVDTEADLELVTTLYRRFLLATTQVDYRDIVRAVRAQPSLSAINAHIPQKDWRSHAS